MLLIEFTLMGTQMSRRYFLKRAVAIGATAAIVGTSLSSVIAGESAAAISRDVDPTPVQSQRNVGESDRSYAGRIFDFPLSPVPLKFFGVVHSRTFAEENYDRLDDLVEHSSIVVSEGNPQDVGRPDIFNDSKAYFGTIAALCQKYRKPLVSLDPDSKTAVIVDIDQSTVGFGVLAGLLASVIIKPSVLTRRSFLGFATAAALSSYLFFSGGSLSSSAEDFIASARNPSDMDEWIDARFGHSQYYLNHGVDQRNVGITEHLLALPGRLSPKELAGGDYILSTFGAAHAVGVEYYFKHPLMRRLKSVIYSVSYGLIDNKEMLKFVPDGNGNWSVEKLK